MTITSNALEFKFTDIHQKINDIIFNKVNYILYRSEFSNIKQIVSFVDINDNFSPSRQLEIKSC